MNASSLVFCAAALLVSLGVAVIAFPYAAMTPEAVAAARTPVPAYELPDVDLGAFGTVPVTELVDYYIENPPAPRSADAAPARAQHFGGC